MKLIIIACGPSAREIDFSRLQHIQKFGMNYAFKITDDLDYYGFFHRYESMAEEIREYIKRVHPQDTICFTQTDTPLGRNVWGVYGNEFKRNVFESGVSGFYGSSIWIILQIAYTLGFREIYFIGLDARKEGNEHHAYYEKEIGNEDLILSIYNDIVSCAELIMKVKPDDLQLFNTSEKSAVKAIPFLSIDNLYK